MSPVHILVVDNYDSFVHNLVQYLGQLGAACTVRYHDAVDVAGVRRLAPDGILLSPGPGDPSAAGVCVPLVTELAGQLPILGVCLGHQAIAAAYGAEVTRAPELLHGMTSDIRHDGSGVFAGLPDPFTACRYHSLAVTEASLPPELVVTARTVGGSGVVMGLRHRTLPLEGVQFHPEAVLTQGGHTLLANWLAGCGLPSARETAPALAAEVEQLRRGALS